MRRTLTPAEEPGTPLEPPGNRWPREMVTHDRIRLTGLLRKSPGNGAFLFSGDRLRHHRGITGSRFYGTLRRFRGRQKMFRSRSARFIATVASRALALVTENPGLRSSASSSSHSTTQSRARSQRR